MTYLLEGVDDTITFLRDEDGKIFAFVLRQDLKEQVMIKERKGRAIMAMASEQPTVVTPADWVIGPRQGEWTYDAYASLPDDGQRYEIIEGVLLLVMSSQSPQHQRIVGRAYKEQEHILYHQPAATALFEGVGEVKLKSLGQ